MHNTVNLIGKTFKSVITAGLFVLLLTSCAGREELMFEEDERISGSESWSEPDAEVVVNAASDGADKEVDGTNAASGRIGPEHGENVGEAASAESEGAKIYVHICGAVVNAGVYELDAGSRVFEAIEAAGGFTGEACQDYVNQAGVLSDAQRLVIPTNEEIEAAKADGTWQELWTADGNGLVSESAGTGTQAPGAFENGVLSKEADVSGAGLVNINTASESELGAISGIGAGKAAAIVKYRQENGNFAAIEDIMNVSGIKEGTYEKIKDKITVN